MDKQEKIRNTRDAINTEIEKHEREIKKLRLDLAFLQEDCKHPNKHQYSAMGRHTGWYCPDCKWET